MKIFKIFILSISTLSIIGCNFDDDNARTPNNTETEEVVTLTKTTYQVPKDVNLIDADIKGSKAQMMSVGTTQDLAAFVQEIDSNTNSPKSYKVTQKGLETAFNQLSSSGGSIDNISLFSSQSFQTPYIFTIGNYKITTNTEIEPLTLAGEILQTLAGTAVTGIPLAASNAPVDTLFRLVLLYGEYEASSFYIAVVIPEKLYSQYQTQSNDITNAARVIPKGKALTTSKESFTQSTGKRNADILFVVDDSGSMSDDQDALSQAADDFSEKMTSSGLTYRSAVITTGSGATDHTSGHAYHILRTTGIIENNNTLLKQSLVAGTNGSSTETGIWNAEQALQSVAKGNSLDGAITMAGMPKTNSTLSVVIISDEKSQYNRRSPGTDFNVSNNLFKNRAIRVYSLIKTDNSSLSSTQYDDLSSETGGIHSNIRNTDSNGSLDFSGFMQQIAQDAGGAASSFVLPNPATVINEVKVNGTVVAENASNGYTYVQSSHSIVFHGTAIPPSGATILVSYDYYQ